MKGSNARAAAGASAVSPGYDLDCHDQLPPAVRQALAECNIVLASEDFLDMHRCGFSTTELVRIARREEQDELHEFNQRHHARHGYHLPALTARVAILRGRYAA